MDNNEKNESQAQNVIDLTNPDLSPTQEESGSSSGSDGTCNLPTKRSPESFRTEQVLEIKESKWLEKTEVLAVLKQSTSLMYQVCSNMVAEKLQTHDSLVLSMLETSERGVLHVLYGQTSSQALNQLTYRFKSNGNWDGRALFLQSSATMQKRGYKCLGVKHCVLVPSSFVKKSHGDAETFEQLLSEQRENVGGSASAQQTARRSARTLFLSLQKKVNSANGYCQFTRSSAISEGVQVPGKCRGLPKIRSNRSTGEYFLGCSGYRRGDAESSPTSSAGWQLQKHSSHTLHGLTDEALVELQKMLDTGRVSDCRTETCMFFSSKGKKATECPDHGTSLEGTGPCPVKMILMQPLGQASCDTAVHKRGDIVRGLQREQNTICFAYLQGVHNHPPPPPPRSSFAKDTLILEESRRARGAPAAHVKLEVQKKLMNNYGARGSGISLSDHRLYDICTALQTGALERESIGTLFEMAADEQNEYVREARTVLQGGAVVLLASNAMLSKAAESSSFAGDATFKTLENDVSTVKVDVSHEKGKKCKPIRLSAKISWYLYNVVAQAHPGVIGSKGVVVARFMMNRLTRDSYCTGWRLFLDHLQAHWRAGIRVPKNLCVIRVPYWFKPEQSNIPCVEIRSVTCDFDAAEIEGIALALEGTVGGPARMHVEHLMIGCAVHFDRDARRRAARLPMDIKDTFYTTMMTLHKCGSIGDAEAALEYIRSKDRSWADWAVRYPFKTLSITAFSKMAAQDRRTGFKDTNIVESQNRRGHHICGVQTNPAIAARRLEELDNISIEESMGLDSGVGAYNILRKRQRFDSLVAPSGSKPSQKKQKRSKLFGIAQPFPGSKIGTCVSRSEAKRGSRKKMEINVLEMKMIQKIVAATMNEVVEEASALQMEKLTDLTMKVENAISAFDARIEILNCLKEVTRDLLLRKTLSSMFLKIKTTGEEIRKFQCSDPKASDSLDCIDVDALNAAPEREMKEEK